MKKMSSLVVLCALLTVLASNIDAARASIIIGGTPPATGPAPGENFTQLSAGIYSFRKSDFTLAAPLGLNVQRVYRSNDKTAAGSWQVRSFGVGFSLSYNLYLYSASENAGQGYTDTELILPDGGEVRCGRTSSCTQQGCTDYTDATFQCTGQPYGPYYGATITYDSALPGWDMTLKNHSVYKFGLGAPLQSVQDRNGNTITLQRSGGQSGNITTISDPNGRYVNLFYNISGHPNLISEGVDSSGRTIFYAYDSSQRLISVKVRTNANPQEKYTYINGTTQLGNISTNKVLAIVSGGTPSYVTITATYTADSNTFISSLAKSIGGTTSYSYTTNGSIITAVSVTDPTSSVTAYHFTSPGYVISITAASGSSVAETTSYSRGSNNVISSTTDALNRQTCYSYDSLENVTAVVNLCGGWNGQSQVTTSYTYGACSQVASTTDPDNVTTSATFDSNCNMVSYSGGRYGTVAYVYNSAGEVTQVTSGNQSKLSIAYNGALDVSSITDSLNSSWSIAEDGHGNLASITDPLSHVTRYVYTGVGSSWSGGLFPDTLSKVTDANNNSTTVSFDFLGNPLTITDPLNHTTKFGFSGLVNEVTETDANGKTLDYFLTTTVTSALTWTAEGTDFPFPVTRLSEQRNFRTQLGQQP
jgi:YD repeat-containing protein